MKNILMLVLFVFALSSCGSRKSQVDKVEENKTVKSSSTLDEKTTTVEDKENNIKKVISSDLNDKTQTFTKTTTEETIDKSKPGYVIDSQGKKTELNNVKRTTTETAVLSDKKQKSISNIDKREKTSKEEEKQLKTANSDESKESKKKKAKQAEREQSYASIIWLFILLLVIYIFIRYLNRKKPL